MTKSEIVENLKFRNIFKPIAIVIASCSLLIITNYLTIKILSASRAYINGESHYSKAQKDATRHLITYFFTKDDLQWQLYNKELSVPKGDKKARIGLINNSDIETIKNGFREGRNNEKDLNDLIWLFKNFQDVSFLAEAISEWEKGDYLIDQLTSIGNEVHEKISNNTLIPDEKEKILQKLNQITSKLSINERNFSDSLGEGTRLIKIYLLLINIFLTLIIIGSVSVYYWRMVNSLRRAKLDTENKNNNLILLNKELDQFVYNASHDLRAPILSLKGLIELTKSENDLDEIRNYLEIMHQSLDKQDQFIKDIINYSRNKKSKISIAPVSLNQIIDECINQHVYIKMNNEIIINKSVLVDEILSDGLKLQIILNNLVSNAIKYSDEKKAKRFISITTFAESNNTKIEIEDNGIGISPEYQSKIFEKFFITNSDNQKSSGLGLYLVKEAVENLKGNINLDSKKDIGSKFTITIPKQHESQL